jgi:hypothetical protein
MYASAAARAPHVRFTQVATDTDANVSMRLARFGEDSSRHAANAAETYAEIAAAGVCFRGYTITGSQHTVLWRPDVPRVQRHTGTLRGVLARDLAHRECAQTRRNDHAAFLFAYRAKPGMDAAFAEGYRRHLDWHAARGDSLAWLAWTVVDGPQLGTFVDGAFGIAFKAFDDRVDPRGDAADAARQCDRGAIRHPIS